MNKIIISLCALLLPLCANAQIDDLFDSSKDSKPVKVDRVQILRENMGVLPAENGKVVIRYNTDIPGKSAKEIYASLGYWAEKRFEREATRGEWPEDRFFKNLMYSSVKQATRAEGIIKCQGAEEMIVTNRFLTKNWAEVYYTLTMNVTDGHLEAVISNIYFTLEPNGERYRLTAEEFITNEAIDKARGRSYKNALKYRGESVKVFKSILNEINLVANTKTN